MQRNDINNKLNRMIRKIWYCNKYVGKVKEIYYFWLAKQFKFDKGHITPINFRPYAMAIVNYLNSINHNKNYNVVEIGCGLGEIIGNIYNCVGKGYDIDKNVIYAARKIYGNTKFELGSFQDIKGQNIEYLITVNFIHGISPIELKKSYKSICDNNNIKFIILDIVRDKKYEFNHDIRFLFKDTKYNVVKKLVGYATLNGRREIYILKKTQRKCV